MIDPNCGWRINQPGVVSEILDGEAIIINLETGVYYSLQGSGAFIWKLIEEQANLSLMVERLRNTYQAAPAIIEEAARNLIEELHKEQLIVPLPAVAVNTLLVSPLVETKEVFHPPSLKKYVDMADLLLLDPIHEVDEKGWPHTQ
jgi:hypothetical protein